jgi:hypothetical protein
LNTAETQESHTRVLKAIEATVRVLAMPGLACLDRHSGESGRAGEALSRLLDRPSFGHWLAALREVSASLAATPDAHAWIRLLRDDLTRPWREAEVVRAANAMRAACTDQRSDRQSFTLLEFLEHAVAYRNRSPEGHGPSASRRDLEERVPLLRDALGSILLKARCLQGLELVYIQEVSATRAGQQISALRLVGNSPRLITDWKLPAPLLGGETLVRDTVLLVPAATSAPIDLYPWIVYGEGSRGLDLFLYDSHHGDGPGYVTGHDGNRYPPSTREDFERLRARHEPRRDSLTPALSELLDVLIADGVIDEAEMERLVRIVRKEGLRSDDAAARALIADEARRRQPGVMLPGGSA